MGNRQSHPSGAEEGACAVSESPLIPGFIYVMMSVVMQQLCSQKEQEFSQQYNESVDAFMKEVELDLMSDQTPPRCMYIDVLAKVEVGTIVTGSGMTLNLKKVSCVALQLFLCLNYFGCRTRCTACAGLK